MELKKIKRAELLNIMVAQSKEIDRLNEELESMKEKLKSRELKIEKCGSIAEASLALTRIFEDAQKAADTYLYNVRNQTDDRGYLKADSEAGQEADG